MGIKDWLEYCNVPKGRTNTLEEVKGKTFAVDASSWMHKILLSGSLGSVPARLFHQFPPGNMQYVVDTWLHYTIECLKSFDIKVVLVFDGARNPAKGMEDEARGAAIEENRAELRRIIADRKKNMQKRMLKCMSDSMYVRVDIVGHVKNFCDLHGIRYCCAPFEADSQLVQLELDGIVDGVIAEDTDLIVLGSKLLLCKLHPINVKSQSEKGKCQIVRVPETTSGIEHLSQEARVFSAMMLGNDYFRRPKGYGPRAVKSIAKKLTNNETTLEQEVINALRSTNATIKDYKVGEGQLTKPPAFHICFKNEEDSGLSLKSLFEGGNFKVALGALGDRSFAPDEQLIGYDAKNELEERFYVGVNTHNVKLNALGEESALIEYDESVAFEKFYRLQWWPRIGPFCPSDPNIFVAKDENGVVNLRIEEPVNDRGERVQEGAILDFIRVPIQLQLTGSLINFLKCRGYTVTGSLASNRRSLECIAARADGLKIRARKYDPKQTKHGTHHYTSDEDLYTEDEIQWRCDSFTVFNAILTDIRGIDSMYIANIFGRRRNGIRRRAFNAFSSGNFDVSTLMTAKATMKDGQKKVSLLRILTAPSQKSKPYWCTLAFLEDGSRDYVETPTSRCDCPAGALICLLFFS